MKGSTRLTTGQAIVRFLKNQYILRDGKEHRLIQGVFGIFGHGNVAGIGQALEEYGGKDLPFYQSKNEQAMVHTATAFAKARRRLSTFACTTSVGPGATNMITGAATATINRLPVLLLPGDIFASRKPNPVLQQLEFPQSMDVSVNDCFKPVSKYWDRINRPEQILSALPEAIRVLSDPAETGAVTICLPEDVQSEAIEFPQCFFEKRVHAIHRVAAPQAMLTEGSRWIRQAKRPMIVAGGGIHYSEAEPALLEFAKQTGIPVSVTQAGKGALLESDAHCLGALGVTGTQAANQIAAEADLVICMGTRLSDFTSASKSQFQNPEVRFLSMNIHAADAHKHGALPLVGDLRSTLEELSAFLQGYEVPKRYRSEVAEAREKWEKLHHEITHPKKQDQQKKLAQSEVIRIVNECLGEEATVVHAAGGLPGDLHKLWRCKDAQDYHSEYGYSCMGYEIAGALGVKMARPEREVYAFLGDGSYLMLNHEIVTSVQEGMKITIILNDNHGYQCIHSLQKNCGGESFGNEFRHREAGSERLQGRELEIDFLENARSLGAVGFKATSESELKKAIEDARRETRTCLIYVPVDAAAGVPGFSWWDVPVAEVSERPKTRQARQDYEKNIQKQKFYY